MLLGMVSLVSDIDDCLMFSETDSFVSGGKGIQSS